MENIVTIDFDIIMAPSIEIYNKEIQGGLTYEDYAFKNIINPIVDFKLIKEFKTTLSPAVTTADNGMLLIVS